eukprot:6151362-Pyramimonas_sp.AAC.1
MDVTLWMLCTFVAAMRVLEVDCVDSNIERGQCRAPGPQPRRNLSSRIGIASLLPSVRHGS